MEIKHCPNCGGSDVKVAGNNLYCKFCDVTLSIKDGVAVVDDVDPLGEQNKRLDDVERDVDVLKEAAGQDHAEPVVEDTRTAAERDAAADADGEDEDEPQIWE